MKVWDTVEEVYGSWKGVLGAGYVYIASLLPGARNQGSETNSYLAVSHECNITRLDIDQTETLVTAAPCRVLAVLGNDGNTGYTDLIDASAIASGSTPKLRVNCGDGTNPQWLGGAIFENGLCVDGESAGHDVTVLWRPL